MESAVVPSVCLCLGVQPWEDPVNLVAAERAGTALVRHSRRLIYSVIRGRTVVRGRHHREDEEG